MELVLPRSVGVATILLHVPVAIGATHKGGAIVLLTLVLFIAREIKPDREDLSGA